MRETGASYNNGRGGEEDSIQVSGTKEEMDALRRMLTGGAWLRNSPTGVLEEPGFTSPKPIEDEALKLEWPTPESRKPNHQEYLYFKVPSVREHKTDGAIYLQHIREYKDSHKYLMKCGFVPLRSRRDREGSFWEIWYLPGPWAAKEEIKGMKTQEIVQWVMRNRLAMSISVEGGHWGAGYG